MKNRAYLKLLTLITSLIFIIIACTTENVTVPKNNTNQQTKLPKSALSEDGGKTFKLKSIPPENKNPVMKIKDKEYPFQSETKPVDDKAFTNTKIDKTFTTKASTIIGIKLTLNNLTLGTNTPYPGISYHVEMLDSDPNDGISPEAYWIIEFVQQNPAACFLHRVSSQPVLSGSIDASIDYWPPSYVPNGTYAVRAYLRDNPSITSTVTNITIDHIRGLSMYVSNGLTTFNPALGEAPEFRVDSLSGDYWAVKVIGQGINQVLFGCEYQLRNGAYMSWGWNPALPNGIYSVQVLLVANPAISISQLVEIKNPANNPSPSPSATSTSGGGGDPTPTATSVPTSTPSPSVSATPIGGGGGGTPTPSPVITPTPGGGTPTPSPGGSSTPDPIPTATPTSTPNPTPSPSGYPIEGSIKAKVIDEGFKTQSLPTDIIPLGSGRPFTNPQCQAVEFEIFLSTLNPDGGTVDVVLRDSSLVEVARWNLFATFGASTQKRLWYGRKSINKTGELVREGIYTFNFERPSRRFENRTNQIINKIYVNFETLPSRATLTLDKTNQEKHIFGTPEYYKVLKDEGSAHVFLSRDMLEFVTSEIFNRGELIGSCIRPYEKATDRYGLNFFPTQIGYRIAVDKNGNEISRIPEYIGEIKVLNKRYHADPRTSFAE